MISRKCSAQVILEYLVMAALIMAAIIYGGPFLVNSIGARFKIMEDNAADSVSENIKQAPPEKCVCNPTSNDPSSWTDIGTECGEKGQCGALETFHQRLCYGCSKTQETACGASSKCCQTPVPDVCGNIDPSDLDKTGLCATREGGASDGRCLDTNGGVQGCLFGELSYKEVCGNNVIKYTCVEDRVACVPPCVSTTWTPLPEDKCVGTKFPQTDNCGTEKEGVEGKKPPKDCSYAGSVDCGTTIPSDNECPCPVGSKCAAGDCVYNEIDKTYECKKNCDNKPAGIYMAAEYYSVSHHGDMPACPDGYLTDPSPTWISNPRVGSNGWKHRKCGKLYKEIGTICDGDPCIRGMSPVDETHVTFHLGEYNALTKLCDETRDDARTVTRSDSNNFISSNSRCQPCGGKGQDRCRNNECTAGRSLVESRSGYSPDESVKGWD
jgi:hypothetical protein